MAWDDEEDLYPESGEVYAPDIFAELSPEDKRAYALFRKVLDGIFAEKDQPPAARPPPRKGIRMGKGKRAAPATGAKPARKRPVRKSPPARRASTPQ